MPLPHAVRVAPSTTFHTVWFWIGTWGTMFDSRNDSEPACRVTMSPAGVM